MGSSNQARPLGRAAFYFCVDAFLFFFHADRASCINIHLYMYIIFYYTLYVKTTRNSRTCDNLNFKCNGFETTWDEIGNKNGRNVLFCCTYKHPGAYVETLISHLRLILPMLLNKQVFITEDLNVNLFN